MISGRKDIVVVHWAFAGSSKRPKDYTEAVPAKQAEPAIEPAQGGSSPAEDLDARLDELYFLRPDSRFTWSPEAEDLHDKELKR